MSDSDSDAPLAGSESENGSGASALRGGGCAVFCVAVVLLVLYGHSADGSAGERRLAIHDARPYQLEPVPSWTWSCENNFCQRRRSKPNETLTSQESCSMSCGLLPLWPRPKDLTWNSSLSSSFKRFQLVTSTGENAKHFVEKVFHIVESRFKFNNTFEESSVDVESVIVDLRVESDDVDLSISTNESYTVSVKKNGDALLANISAYSCFGVRHGLETLSQLIWFDKVSKTFRIMYDVTIKDQPSFPHRGFHLDTARNFFSIPSIKTLIDGMGMNKLNVFHMHLTDATSFPVVLPINKQFADYGAYSEDMKYSVEDMKDLVEYARYRGVRVVLEVDAPSHVYEGWTWDDNLVICGEGNVFNGHLNPDYPKTLEVLESIYRDLFELGSARDTFHIGGDEVNLTCWSDTATRSKYPDGYHMWADFTNSMVDRVKRAAGGEMPPQVVLWSSPLTDRYIGLLEPKENLVVQYWFGKVDPIVQAGVKVIFSTVGRWYLDCGFGPWRTGDDKGSCDPYTPWTKVYEYRPWSDVPADRRHLVAGGEACLWSEEVAEAELQARAWPRGAAFAERCWSDPPAGGRGRRAEVGARLRVHAARMRGAGVGGAAPWPHWCDLNAGRCR